MTLYVLFYSLLRNIALGIVINQDTFFFQANTWLREHDENVAVIHCKGGKVCTFICNGIYNLKSQEQECYYLALIRFFLNNLQGRTGTMICILALYRGIYRNAEECLAYFGDQRTDLRVDEKFQVRDKYRPSEFMTMYKYILRQNNECQLMS